MKIKNSFNHPGFLKIYLIALLFTAALLFTTIGLADEESLPDNAGSSVAKVDAGTESAFSVLPYPGYSSDTGFLVGIKYVHKNFPFNYFIYDIEFEYTLMNQKKVEFNVVRERFFNERLTSAWKFDYRVWPEYFFGIGNQNNYADGVQFTPETLTALWELQYSISQNWGIHGGYQFQSTKFTVMPGQVPANTPGRDGGNTGRFDIGVYHDTRDNPVSPTTGGLRKLSFEKALKSVGSDFDYSTLRFEATQNFNPWWQHTIALRFLMMSAFQSPPFFRMPFLGGNSVMRGLKINRYLDNTAGSLSFEYRLPVYQRLSAAAFVETGRTFPSLSDLSLADLHLSYGGGLRYFLTESRLILVRVDIGHAADETGIYMAFGMPY